MGKISDRERIVQLNAEAEQYIQTDPARAYTLAKEACEYTEKYTEETTDILHQRASALLLMARSYRTGGKSEEMLSFATRALAIYEAVGDDIDRVETLLLMGLAHDYKGDYTAALEVKLLGLPIAERMGTQGVWLLGKLQAGIGASYWRLGDTAHALEYLHKSFAVAETLQKHKGMAQLLMNMGNIYSHRGELPRALKHYVQGRNILVEKTPEALFDIAQMTMNLATVFHRMGDHDSAMKYYLESLDSQEQGGFEYSQEMLVLLENIAGVCQEQGAYSLALQYGTRALAVADAIQAYGERAHCLLRLGKIVLLMGDIAEAIEYGQQSLEIAEHSGDKWAQEAAFRALGKMHLHSQHYDKALECLHQAMAFHSDLASAEAETETALLLGMVYTQTQHHEQAVEQLEIACNLSKKYGDNVLLIESSKELANLYESMNRIDKALYYFKQLRDAEKAVFNSQSENTIQTLKVLHDVEKAKKEAEIHKLQSHQLQREVEVMKNELTIRTLSLSQRTELLRKVQRGLAKIEGGVADNIQKGLGGVATEIDAMLLDSKAVRALRRAEQLSPIQHVQQELQCILGQGLSAVYGNIQAMMNELRGALSDDALWDVFEQQFQKLHTGFMETLTKSYPQLSVTERKVCSLIKINMSSKEISHILNISSRSVDTYRYHIRQKLQIPTTSNLVEFITALP